MRESAALLDVTDRSNELRRTGPILSRIFTLSPEPLKEPAATQRWSGVPQLTRSMGVSLLLLASETEGVVAGWDSQIFRRVHIPQIGGSNPPPAISQLSSDNFKGGVAALVVCLCFVQFV
jgi:hypothetical protein